MNISPLYAEIQINSSSPLKGRSPKMNSFVPPCGGIPRSKNIATFKPKQKVKIEWQEIVNHPGKYQINFSEKYDQDFESLGVVEDNQNKVFDLPHSFSKQVILPNAECEQCTLQIVQVAAEDPARPFYYYNCYDIRLAK